jgi:myosin heavy subunit
MEIQFDGQGQILGAKIKTYLLEKSRITKQISQERNYHVIFQEISHV